MSFTIVIKDNDSGKELVNNNNATAIIGGFVTEDNQTAQMAFVKSTSKDLTCAIIGAKKAIRKVESESPLIGIVAKFFEEFKGDKE